MGEELEIPSNGAFLNAALTIPDPCTGVIVVAHGSGSTRRSARNLGMAEGLNEAGFATLLLDLLAPEEEAFDPDTLQIPAHTDVFSRRLVSAIDWVQRRNDVGQLGIGIYAASTAAAAALRAAAERPRWVDAVVTRAVGLDLDEERLSKIEAPTLFILGGDDGRLLVLAEAVASRIPAETRLEIVACATFSTEKPSSLERVATLTSQWFREHVGKSAPLPVLTQADVG